MGARASDQDLPWWSAARVGLVCAGVLLILRGLGQDSAWVEANFVDGWGWRAAWGLAWVTAAVPVSVAELLVGALLIAELWWLFDALAEVGARRRGVLNALAGGVLHVGSLVMALTVVFYAVWGLAYLRPGAMQRLGLRDVLQEEQGAPAYAAALAAAAVRNTNAAYLALHGGPDGGEVTTPSADTDIDALIDRGFARVAEELKLAPSFAAPRGPAKRPFAGDVLSWLGIGGIYVPFTGEATVNGGPPGWALVVTTAHEKAHQRMVTREDEATFMGILACLAADDPLLRYAGWEAASRQLLRVVAVDDPEAAARLRAELVPGVQRDQAASRAYWEAYEGPMELLASWMNHNYLQANQVHEGVAAYGRAGRLLVALAADEQRPAWAAKLPAWPTR